MELTSIASYLISPGKGLEKPPIVNGTMIPFKGTLYNVLRDIFISSDRECDIPVRFLMSEGGEQINQARDLVLAFRDDANIKTGRKLAERLRDFTTNKSGLGLFFAMLGKGGKDFKIVLSRFPADQGILADLTGDKLEVEFIERIFMKNSRSYKAALYGNAVDGTYWSGLAVDKQLNTPIKELADYWISDFLSSDFRTTSIQGTKRLAQVLKAASQSKLGAESKAEIIAAGKLIPGFNGRSITINEILDDLHISQETKAQLINSLPYPELASETFVLDREEFLRNAPALSITLDNGGMLIAPTEQFDETFTKERVEGGDSLKYRFTTEGSIIDERIRGK